MLNPNAVVAAELVAPVVAHAALLREAGGRLEHALVRLDAKVAISEYDLFARFLAVNRAADQAVRAVHPVVQAVRKTVHARLKILGGEASIERANVGLAVAVGVLGVKISGAAQMSTPLRQAMTPVGNGTSSRNDVDVSYLPSPFVSSRKTIRPPGLPLPSIPDG